MPTQAFSDSEVNIEVFTTSRQNSQNEETDALKAESGDLKKCREGLERRQSKHMNVILSLGFVLIILILAGMVAWLTWLTYTLRNLDKSGPQQLPFQPRPEAEVNNDKHEDIKKKSGDGLSGISMVLDITSLFDETILTLSYQTTRSKFNFSSNGIQYSEDGSFKILKSGRYLLHSKLSLTNEDFTKTKSFRHCIMLGDDASLECDQGSVSPRTKKNSQIWRFEYLEQNQALKVIMTNKDLVYRDPFYNKLEIVEFAPGTRVEK